MLLVAWQARYPWVPISWRSAQPSTAVPRWYGNCQEVGEGRHFSDFHLQSKVARDCQQPPAWSDSSWSSRFGGKSVQSSFATSHQTVGEGGSSWWVGGLLDHYWMAETRPSPCSFSVDHEGNFQVAEHWPLRLHCECRASSSWQPFVPDCAEPHDPWAMRSAQSWGTLHEEWQVQWGIP